MSVKLYSAKTIAPVKEYTDKEIIECLRNRDSNVVKYLVQRYMPVIRHMVLENGGTSDDAQDIFQEGLMIILEKIDEKSFTLTSKFITLLYCICSNLWKMILNKRKAADTYIRRESVFYEDSGVEASIDNDLYQKIFTEAFNSLEEACKKILRLSWSGMSPTEISEMLGVTYGYVLKKKSESQAELLKKIRAHPDSVAILGSEKRLKSIVQ